MFLNSIKVYIYYNFINIYSNLHYSFIQILNLKVIYQLKVKNSLCFSICMSKLVYSLYLFFNVLQFLINSPYVNFTILH